MTALLRARPVDEDPGDDWPAVIEEVLGGQVILRSYGPTAAISTPLRQRS